jgi:hypothetical protein
LPACSAQHISWQVVELPEKKSVTNFCNVHPQIVTAGMHPMHVEEREAAALQPEILTKKPNPSSLITAIWKRVTYTQTYAQGERERERERERGVMVLSVARDLERR